MEASPFGSIDPTKLTPREHQVLLLLLEGVTSKEIAQKLGITFKTAASHRANILEKANVNRTVELLKYAIKNGIIQA